MSIQWVNSDDDSRMTLPRLVKSYVDNKDPSLAVRHILYLTDLLILSNHLTEAHLIASAVFNLVEDFETTTKGEPLDSPITVPFTMDMFWHVNQTSFPRPKRVPICSSEFSESRQAENQWGKYRESTRTGWMLEHVGLAEPKNPSSIWRETDDPAMLAMCARLLAKTTTPGTYPPENRAREALEAAQKLYATPERSESEGGGKFTRKHRYLLYRRMVVDLAIRLGELQTAADILGQGLVRDGLVNGGDLRDFLMLPGIYDVLPLLACGGKETNPFFISKDDAVVMVREIIAALELRAKHGRQWELHPSKVGWKELLDRLSEGAWKAHNRECRAMGMKSAKDVLFEPATEEEITAAEETFGELPADLKEMVRLANGFKGGWHFFEGGIAGIQSMEIDGGYTDIGYQHYEEDSVIVEEMIQLQPGIESDEFIHYIILPKFWKDAMEQAGKEVKDGEYQYWQWASWWGCGIRHWDSVRDYVADCVERVEEMIETGEEESWEPSPYADYPGEVVGRSKKQDVS